MKAMIFAAGLGTRLKPWTDEHPKALAIVNGQSLLQRNILYLQQFGINDVLINVHHFANQIIDAVTNNHGWGSKITFSDETDAVLETGGGLKKASWFFELENNFVVMNADILTNMPLNEMIEHHEASAALATLAVSNRPSSRQLLFDTHTHTLCGWKNVLTGELKGPVTQPGFNAGFQAKSFSGIHIINHQLLSLMEQKGKFGMIEVYLSLAAKYPITQFDQSNYSFIDVGKPESIALAEKMFV